MAAKPIVAPWHDDRASSRFAGGIQSLLECFRGVGRSIRQGAVVSHVVFVACRLSTRGTFTVASGANSLTGSGNQVFACTGPTTGAATACAGFASVLPLPSLPTGSMDAISVAQ